MKALFAGSFNPFTIGHESIVKRTLCFADEVVIATLDGTIVATDYSLENGYTISIQHANDFISIYKNCERILKNTGDQVLAGDAVGFVSNASQTRISKPYLHFEIWQKGTPINPTDYIIF